MSIRYEDPIFIGPTDCLLNIDNIIAFIRKYGGGLPVDRGEEIAQFIIDHLFPIFPIKQRVATYDLHVEGSITSTESYIGIDDNTQITIEMYIGGEIKLSNEAQFTLANVATLLTENGGHFMVWSKHGKAGSPQTEMDPTYGSNDWLLKFAKGTDPKDDANSAFRSLRGVLTHLHSLLRGLGFKRLFLVGLAYDVCVGLSAIDAANLGFEVYIIKQGTRAINIPPSGDYIGSIATIEAEFVRAGVHVIEDVKQLQRAA